MYTLNATFDAHVDEEQVLTAVLEALPEGTEATLQREPVLLDGNELTDEHIGSSIRANIGEQNEYGGTIEALFPGENGGRLLIVDGKPHTVRWWDTFQVIPPITAGEHTPDEPEIFEAEADLSPDNYNEALELALQTEAAVAPHLFPIGYLTRVQFEEAAGRVLTDDEFLVLSGSVRRHLMDMLDTVAGSVVVRHVGLLEQMGDTNA